MALEINMATFNVGRNVVIDIEGSVLTATVDLSQEGDISTTGKTISIATTGAPADIALPNGSPAKMNLSIFAPVPLARVDEAATKAKAYAAVQAAKKAAKAA